SLSEPWEKEFEIKNLTDGNPIRLHYVRMHENTGGAGGFHEGVKRAYERGYDWLWLMDDNTIPTNEVLITEGNILISIFKNSSKDIKQPKQKIKLKGYLKRYKISRR
ncbi:MAG: hypothetical protein ACP5J2_10155, partial [Caldisericum sp.]